MLNIPDLDRPIYGARAIGAVANLLNEKGDVDLQATFYALARGLIPAEKFGRRWRSTPRRILKLGVSADAINKPTTQEAAPSP